jgi:hypothetical protein
VFRILLSSIGWRPLLSAASHAVPAISCLRNAGGARVPSARARNVLGLLRIESQSPQSKVAASANSADNPASPKCSTLPILGDHTEKCRQGSVVKLCRQAGAALVSGASLPPNQEKPGSIQCLRWEPYGAQAGALGAMPSCKAQNEATWSTRGEDQGEAKREGQSVEDVENVELPKKKCVVCDIWKPSRNFQVSQSGTDGRNETCRACEAKRRAVRAGKELHHLALPPAEAWEQARTCSKCKQVQELRDFSRRAQAKDGLSWFCRSCVAEMDASLWAGTGTEPNSATKRCTLCEEEKPASSFYPNRRKFSGLQSYCKRCNKAKAKEYQLKNRTSMLYNQRREKLCGKCNTSQRLEAFRMVSIRADAHHNICKACENSSWRECRRRRSQSKRPLQAFDEQEEARV